MSIDAFQQAFADLVGHPGLRAAVGAGDLAAFDRLDLTARERRRLAGLAAQPGMRLNGLLQRANRFTPLPRLFPLTCAVLGPALPRLVHGFWEAWPRTSMQFEEESGRFAAFLRDRMATGDMPHPALPAILDLETALLDLRFARPAPAASRLHPRLRVIAFRQDPERVIAEAQAGRVPPTDLPEGEQVVLVDGRGEDPRILRLAIPAGRVLLALARGEAPGPDDDAELAALAAAGLNPQFEMAP